MTGNRDRWTWSPAEIRRVGYRVVDLIADHLTTVPTRPVFQPVPEEVVGRFLERPVPQAGLEPDEILELYRQTIEPYPFGNGHPASSGG